MVARPSNRSSRCSPFGVLRWVLLVVVGAVLLAVVAGHWRSPLQFDSPLSGGVVQASDGAEPPPARLADKLESEAAPDREPNALLASPAAVVELAQKQNVAHGQSEKTRPAEPVPSTQFCDSCCNDGEKFVKCFDVSSCNFVPGTAERYALVLSHFGAPNARFRFLPFVSSWRAQAAAHPGVQIDILLLITKKDARFLAATHHKLMKDNDVRIVEVEWNVPPNMVYKGQSAFNHYRDDGSDWCGPQDLMRLHAFTLEGYDAVAYYDSDIEFHGDILPIFRCASKPGRFITTGGGIGVPLNVGFFALRPDPRFMLASRFLAENYNYSLVDGWGHSGWAPSKVKYAGGECGQGFLHTLLYKRGSEPSMRSLEAAGLGGESAVEAVQIDKCVWNYQTSFQCPKDFNCSLVRAHHKPKKPGKNPNECLKRGVKWYPNAV